MTGLRLIGIVLLVAVGISACGGGGGDSPPPSGPSPTPTPLPVPVDGVGVFYPGSVSFRFAPSNIGHSGGGRIISDGTGLAIGGWRTNSEGIVFDYRFSRSGTSTAGSLHLRRYLSSHWCSGTDTGALTDNASFSLANFILTNNVTGEECRGGASGSYSASMSEYPATSIADFVGNYSSTNGPGSDQGGFDVGGNRFTVRVESNGGFVLNGGCQGTITLVEAGKGIARISNVIPTICGDASGAAIDGLAAFDGSNLLIFLVQTGTYHFWSGTLQKQ